MVPCPSEEAGCREPSRSIDKDEVFAGRTGLSEVTCCSNRSDHQNEQLFRKGNQERDCCFNERYRVTLIQGPYLGQRG